MPSLLVVDLVVAWSVTPEVHATEKISHRYLEQTIYKKVAFNNRYKAIASPFGLQIIYIII